VSANLHDIVVLLVVVVFETLVTATLTQIPKQRTVISTVRELVTDHAEDEARHSVFYSELFGYLWGQLDPKQRGLLGPLIPSFIVAPLSPPTDALRAWLTHVGVERDDVDGVVGESYPLADVREGMVRTARATLRLFGNHGLYEDPRTREAFAAHGILPDDA
jgi:hypothetical protein